MPELPEVETTRRGIEPHLTGGKILSVLVREWRLRWPVTPEIEEMAGATISAVRRRAKYLLLETERGTLLAHLGMSGSLRLAPADAPWRAHDHVAFGLPGGMELRYHDPRRFGCLLWLQEDPMQHPLLAGLGPEPLEDGFDADHLHREARGRSVSVKSLIMDSSVVCGVGNIYACESLFLAGIRPSLPAGKLSRPRCAKLVEAIRRVLAASIEMGGTTLRDFVNQDGQPGYFKQTLRVYDREGEPCRICGRPVRRRVQNQRSTFFCASCQK